MINTTKQIKENIDEEIENHIEEQKTNSGYFTPDDEYQIEQFVLNKKWVDVESERRFLRTLLDSDEEMIDEKVRYSIEQHMKDLLKVTK